MAPQEARRRKRPTEEVRSATELEKKDIVIALKETKDSMEEGVRDKDDKVNENNGVKDVRVDGGGVPEVKTDVTTASPIVRFLTNFCDCLKKKHPYIKDSEDFLNLQPPVQGCENTTGWIFVLPEVYKTKPGAATSKGQRETLGDYLWDLMQLQAIPQDSGLFEKLASHIPLGRCPRMDTTSSDKLRYCRKDDGGESSCAKAFRERLRDKFDSNSRQVILTHLKNVLQAQCLSRKGLEENLKDDFPTIWCEVCLRLQDMCREQIRAMKAEGEDSSESRSKAEWVELIRAIDTFNPRCLATEWTTQDDDWAEQPWVAIDDVPHLLAKTSDDGTSAFTADAYYQDQNRASKETATIGALKELKSVLRQAREEKPTGLIRVFNQAVRLMMAQSGDGVYHFWLADLVKRDPYDGLLLIWNVARQEKLLEAGSVSEVMSLMCDVAQKINEQTQRPVDFINHFRPNSDASDIAEVRLDLPGLSREQATSKPKERRRGPAENSPGGAPPPPGPTANRSQTAQTISTQTPRSIRAGGALAITQRSAQKGMVPHQIQFAAPNRVETVIFSQANPLIKGSHTSTGASHSSTGAASGSDEVVCLTMIDQTGLVPDTIESVRKQQSSSVIVCAPPIKPRFSRQQTGPGPSKPDPRGQQRLTATVPANDYVKATQAGRSHSLDWSDAPPPSSRRQISRSGRKRPSTDRIDGGAPKEPRSSLQHTSSGPKKPESGEKPPHTSTKGRPPAPAAPGSDSDRPRLEEGLLSKQSGGSHSLTSLYSALTLDSSEKRQVTMDWFAPYDLIEYQEAGEEWIEAAYGGECMTVDTYEDLSHDLESMRKVKNLFHGLELIWRVEQGAREYSWVSEMIAMKMSSEKSPNKILWEKYALVSYLVRLGRRKQNPPTLEDLKNRIIEYFGVGGPQ